MPKSRQERGYLPSEELKKIVKKQRYNLIHTLSPLEKGLEEKVKPNDKIVILGQDGKTRNMTFLEYKGRGKVGELYCVGRNESGNERGRVILIGSDEFTTAWSHGWKVVKEFPHSKPENSSSQ